MIKFLFCGLRDFYANKKNFYQTSREKIGQILYFLFLILCSSKCFPVYSYPVSIVQISQKSSDNLIKQNSIKNSDSTILIEPQPLSLDYKSLQMVKNSAGRPLTNNANQPYFVWTKDLEYPVVPLTQKSKKKSLKLIEKRNSKTKTVAYSTCKIASLYATYRLFQYLNQKYFSWPTMPITFHEEIRNRLSWTSNIKRGHYTYKEYFTDGLIRFINIPPDKEIAEYKICKILEKSNFFLEQLDCFCEYPRIWIENRNNRLDTVSEAVYEECQQDLKRLSRECSDLSLAYKNSDLSFYYERHLFDITSNFEGDPGFFDFLFSKLILNFWRITWEKSI